MKKIIFTLGLALGVIPVFGADIGYSYNFAGNETGDYGTGKTETYDVAVRLANPSFIGAKVTGIAVPLPSEGVSEVSGWLSSELKLKKKNGKNVNDPDMASKEATVADGYLRLTFDTPCTIPAEGIYVGYSFTVTTLNDRTEAPVAVAAGAHPDGLYLHTSRTKLRWGPMSEDLGKVSVMSVSLSGDFPAKSAVLTIGEVYGEAGSATTVTLPITNCGTDPVSSIEYTGKVSGKTFSGTADLDSPLAGHIGATGSVEIEIVAVDEAGEYPLEISVIGIDGVAVQCNPATGTLKNYPFLPVNRPLVEEYTGLWCGWCPKGYVALETMRAREGDLFIGVAYHNGDEMAFSGKTPNSVSSYPGAYVNRSASINIAEIYGIWGEYRAWIPDGGVEASVEWADEAHKTVKATSTVRFIEDHSDADYRIGYILIADGMSNERWKQHNSYAGHADKKDDMPGELGDLFINGSDYVEGLVFNDVALAATPFEGQRGAIPSEIVAGEEYSHSHVFDLEKIPVAVINSPEKLRVVAVLTDGRSGKFINCNSSLLINGDPFVTPGEVNDVVGSGEKTETARWTLDGHRVDGPVKGINIVRYSDGSVRKELVR